MLHMFSIRTFGLNKIITSPVRTCLRFVKKTHDFLYKTISSVQRENTTLFQESQIGFEDINSGQKINRLIKGKV